MKNKLLYSLIILAAASATFVGGSLYGSLHERKKRFKINGQLKVAYDGEDDDQPNLGFLLYNMKDLKNKYIILEVKPTIIEHPYVQNNNDA